jgi:hypothetical protein
MTTTSTTTTTTTSTTSTSTTAVTGTIYPTAGYYPIGCYEDKYVNYPFVASGGYYFPSPFTLPVCAQICVGYAYFGVYASTYCICGASFDFTLPDDPSFCNTPCGGDPSTFCGGFGGAQGLPVWDFYQYETATV